jgi:hypothetical protein
MNIHEVHGSTSRRRKSPTADTSLARLAGNPEKRREKKTMNGRVSIWFAKLGANEEEIDEKTTQKKKSSKIYIHTYIKTCSPAREDCDITASKEISRARHRDEKTTTTSAEELLEALELGRARVGIFPVSSFLL